MVLATALLLATVGPVAAFPGRSSGVLEGADRCPVTRPNGVVPPGESRPGALVGDFADEVLWTNLWMWGEGVVPVDAAHRNDAGEAVDLKWAWFRLQPGRLAVEGRRLDGDAPPLRPWIPEGYGPSGFQVSGLTFPTPGCWQIAGRLLDGEHELGRLTFVVRVVYLEASVAYPSSSARSVLR